MCYRFHLDHLPSEFLLRTGQYPELLRECNEFPAKEPLQSTSIYIPPSLRFSPPTLTAVWGAACSTAIIMAMCWRPQANNGNKSSDNIPSRSVSTDMIDIQQWARRADDWCDNIDYELYNVPLEEEKSSEVNCVIYFILLWSAGI